MKVAIIHDWLVVNGGAEKVLKELIDIYPQANVYTLVDFLPEEDRNWLGNTNVTTSFIQRLPFAQKKYRNYFPLFPIAIEQFDLSGYDLVISSSYSAAKGVITGPEQLHLSYCHSPARYAWDMQEQYLRESGMSSGVKSIIARYFLHKFRIWDVRTANGVDKFVANSSFIKKRINKCYRREADVIYPPVDIKKFTIETNKEDFYLAASRLVPYKRLDLIAEAFVKMPSKKLKIIGDGPQMQKIKEIVGDAENIELLGYQSDEVMLHNMQKAKAFVFAAEEDFGIIPVEAQACGTPVIAFGKGGCLETVKNNVSGIHFKEQTASCIIEAVTQFESQIEQFSAEEVRLNAEKFSCSAFKMNVKSLIEKAMLDL
ncbi:glycosyltransferase family 4 protein [Pseudoalteromonas sp. Angola-30]|uniref:glycosyltransferase family 4 protein n=1 Tax=Pseudoalteromonas sp. Angola-30 TaxID=3025341 RepID=UPI0023585AD1|nr:glycosyltransferase family 4 protein [Pseudoalteromonas sp. Angola-30]MDC9525393.1 glycosyltransferase family 4 protein [Pseudoalteromonas sp. Angola-30]